MRAKQALRRRSLFLTIAVVLGAMTASPAWSQPHNVSHRPILQGSVAIFFGGAGGGSVTISAWPLSLAGNACNVNCTRPTGSIGRTVTLTANPDGQSVFAGWGGSCSGTAPSCTLTSVLGLRAVAYFRPNFKTLAAGQAHTCALRPAGDVVCWGRNSEGQLGTGDGSTQGSAQNIANAVAIAGGGFHTCALIAGGTVQCWGNNQYGQVGVPNSGALVLVATPVAVPGISDAVAVMAGGFHTCILHVGGTASCWGSNSKGQLGDGTNHDSSAPVTVNLSIEGNMPLAALAGGGLHTCAIVAATANVVCWGANNVGQLGQGSHSNSEPFAGPPVMTGGDPGCPGFGIGCANPDPPPAPMIFKARAIAASIGGNQGGFHTVALDLSGQDFGWGNNNEAEINPTIGGEQDFAQRGAANGGGIIAAGGFHTCVAMLSFRVICYGSNSNGQLGTSTPGGFVTATLGPLNIAAGAFHTCAVIGPLFNPGGDPAGTVMCWGDNDEGQVRGVAQPGTNVLTPVTLNFP
jgi:Regulator of chromosome condensation (RCC1) repeat